MDRYFCNRCALTKPSTDFSEIAKDQARCGDENAMCQDCIDALFRAKLARGEVQGFIKEDRARMLKRTRNPVLEAMQGAGRWGIPMHSSALIFSLSKLVPNLVVLDGRVADDIGFYRARNEKVDFICYTNSGTLPEYSIVVLNKDRQPIHEQRGWRTVLLRFIKAGLLTEEQVEKEFGRISNPEQARFWLKELYDHRHRDRAAA
jgi:hypothetical protein